MRSFKVGMFDERLRILTCLLQVGRPSQGEALRLVGAIEPLNKRILLGVMRITDVDFHAQAGSKTDESGRKITASGATHEAADRDRG
jgi:hypothetical protein